MKLSIVATRGSHTALVNLLTTVLAAAVSEIEVRVLLREEAAYMLTRSKIARPVLSGISADVPGLSRRLSEAGLDDLHALLREAKRQGDVRFMVCSSSFALFGLSPEDLLPEIDEVRGLTSFLLEEISDADTVLSF